MVTARKPSMWKQRYEISADGVQLTGRVHVRVHPHVHLEAEQVLKDASGRQVGSVRRPSMWRSDVQADLPGLPPEVQVFALVVVLTMWEQQDAVAATSAAI